MTGSVANRRTVMIADDHAVVADGLARVLQAYYTVGPTVTELAGLIAAITMCRPDVVVVDLIFAGECSLPLIRRALALRDVESRFVVLTAHESPAMTRSAFEAGVHAVLLKGCSVQDLRLAIDAALEGRRLIPPILEATGEAGRPRRVDGDGVQLRAGQVRVLLLLHEGLSRAEVADRLRISVRGVDHHIRLAKQTTGIRNLRLLLRWVGEHEELLRR
ncbi:MAG: response regulator transcription factor [Gemmatimonadales bacterium]|nr:response regulator transcription factor [Gemmatimonadales bacterium]